MAYIVRPKNPKFRDLRYFLDSIPAQEVDQRFVSVGLLVIGPLVFILEPDAIPQEHYLGRRAVEVGREDDVFLGKFIVDFRIQLADSFNDFSVG